MTQTRAQRKGTENGPATKTSSRARHRQSKSRKPIIISVLVVGLLAIVAGLYLVFVQPRNRQPVADYTAAQAESVLEKGKKIDGRTVKLTVKKLEPKSAFGYNIEAGKHLNFVDSDNPEVKVGQTVILKVNKVKSFVGSWLLSYTDLKKQ